MKQLTLILLALTWSLVFVSCKQKRMMVNPGAHVTVDGTSDGLENVQRDFKDAAKTERGITVTFDSDVLFPLNSSYLTDEAKTEIDKLVELMGEKPKASLIVEGYTDATGTEDYNLWLSEKRAEAVKNHMVSSGVAENRIAIEGRGQANPVAPNNTKEGRERNRRVEVTIVDGK